MPIRVLFDVTLFMLSAIIILMPSPGHAQRAVSAPVVLMTCSTTETTTIAGIQMPATRHFQAQGETVDEAEARFKLSWGGDDFNSCTDFRAVWTREEGDAQRFHGSSADDLVRQLAEAGAPLGAVGKWKLDRLNPSE